MILQACAAALYIVGLEDDARKLLSPFSYGEEFIRINKQALDAYCGALDSNEVQALEHRFEQQRDAAANEKQIRQNREGSNYMADMDLPPSESEEEEEEEEEEDD
jgi:pre-rRNA-processing protein TSR3